MRILGMMSGTSVDGIDAVIVDFHGIPPALEWKVLFQHHVDFTPDLRTEIFRCFRPETGTVDRICALNFSLGRAYAHAALETIERSGIAKEQIDWIANHGQTVWHIPAGQPDASTLQLGDPAVIAELTKLPVVSHFRNADMAAGGHGAPIVSFLDVMMLSDNFFNRASQNIGGIGNMTFLPAYEQRGKMQPIAFDTGPGNMLIDDAMERITYGQAAMDRDGAMAARGRVNEAFLEEMLAEPYFALRPPKTTGRELFGKQFGQVWFEKKIKVKLSDEDYIATLTAFTAESIVRAYRDFLPVMPDQVIVAGGGSKNKTLMKMLRTRLNEGSLEGGAEIDVIAIDQMGIPSDAKEAVAFALMAYQTVHRRVGNIPSATGAFHSVIMGSIAYPFLPAVSEKSVTEARNARTMDIDQLSALALVERINDEDQRVAQAIAEVTPQIALAVTAITARIQRGGRLIALGAGTSGRLAVLDASEILPTFGVPKSVVMGRIAGGFQALTDSVEAAEDSEEDGAAVIREVDVQSDDCVIGVAASGNTPYVIGALKEARARGALTVGIACNSSGRINAWADIAILPIVGPEVVTGSTRMKAGTAQKMALNMISTAVMVKLGKTFGNLMVDVQPTNQKLIDRQRRIVAEACQISAEKAELLLVEASRQTKAAIVMQLAGCSAEEAQDALKSTCGLVRSAILKLRKQ